MTESCSRNNNPAKPFICGVMGNEEESVILDALSFQSYYNRLRLLAINRFKWEGLPDSCNALALEKWLYYYGKACFVYDENLGFINLKCTGSDTINIYDIPVSYNCYSVEYEKDFETYGGKFVLIRNNALDLPTDSDIQLFARRLAEAERTIDVNLNAQKTPVVVCGDERERLTMRNAYKNFSGNVPVMFTTKDFDTKSFQTLSTGAPFITDKVQTYKRNLWAEIMAYLGLNNVEHEKKERLTEDEVNANNALIENYSQIGLAWRQSAAEEANKKLWAGKYNVSVRLRTETEMKEIINAKPATEEGGGENG